MKSNQFQQLDIASLGGCRWNYDLATGCTTYSNEFLDLIGYAPGEQAVDTEWVSKNIHPEDLTQWHNAFVNAVKGIETYFDCELRFRHKEDFFVWIQTRGVVTERDRNGRALNVAGVVFDISQRKTAKENESRYRHFLDNIPDAISLKDEVGRYLYINRQFESWLGKPSYQIYGQTAEEIFENDHDELALLRAHEEKVWDSREAISMERSFPRTDDGKTRHAMISKYPIFDENGNMLGIGTTNTDISAQFHAQEAIRLSEQRYRRLFESAPTTLAETDWSRGKALIDSLHEQGIKDIRQHLIDNRHLLHRQDQVLKVLSVNHEALRLYRSGSVEELINYAETDIREELRLGLIDELVAFDQGQKRSTYRGRGFRLDGEEFPLIRVSEMYGNDPDDWSLVLISVQDISVEVEAARQLESYQEELRSMAGQISLAEESERRRISSELHDGTIQNLVLARIHLANLQQQGEPQAALELAKSIDALLESSLSETRSLIFEISPPVLYELGLEPAVEWLAEHYKQRSGFEITITSDEISTRLPEDLKIVLFQSVRELLVNVAKHAQASHVSIDWKHGKDAVVLTIQDDGIGFDVNSATVRLATQGGFGLFAVRERLKLLGADIEIESSEEGTRICITAPVFAE